jgi:L-aspartate oxidase
MAISISTTGLEHTSFLVVGSGIAGLYTALKLSEFAEVTLITKETLEESNTAYAQGGIAAAISPSDSPELHYEDTIRVGAGICLPAAVKILVNEGPERVRELISLGVPFDCQAGEPALTREAAHSRSRILHADGDATGREISRALTHDVINNPRIKIKENIFVAALLTGPEGCYGILALEETGETKCFLSGATILATGGCGQIFSDTTNPKVATGDGMAVAFRAGAALSDMEFMQFHPTALYLPTAPRFLISEAVRGEGGLLRNKQGVRFMPSYHEQAELAPRDIVARSIFCEMKKTGDDHVYLDLSSLAPDRIKSRFPNIYETCLEYGVDITKEMIPVAPAAHYMMGGIATDLWGRTALPHLFACGEVANSGVHGANRLASNSLLDGLVLGHRIFEYFKTHKLSFSELPQELKAEINGETDPATIKNDLNFLKMLVSKELGIIRNQEGLEFLLHQLSSSSSGENSSLKPQYLELQNMRLIARLMATAALERKESRGSHFRSDYPAPDPSWIKRIFQFPVRTEIHSADKVYNWPW